MVTFPDNLNRSSKRCQDTIIKTEKYQLLSTLFEIATDAIFVIDLKGKIVLFNEAAHKQRGYSKEEMSKMTLFEIDTPAAAKRVKTRLETIKKEGSAIFESEHLKKDGTVLPVEIHSRLITIGRKKFFLSVIRDITERKQSEEALKKTQTQLKEYTSDLERIVKERTLELREKERLAAIGQTAGMVGHDLRNPLQTIVSELYLAESELAEMSAGPKKTTMLEAINNISEQVEYMDKIVSDLQTFVKPVQPRIQTVYLESLLSALMITQTIPENIQTTIKIPLEITVQADSQLLKRVFINLITNAIQAMPKGGKLTIEAQVTRRLVKIVVQDNGLGIPDEVKPKIFTPLFTTKSKGQGFGLAVCKRVLEAQGGSISFDSEVGKGTKFTVTLPG